ncbi:PREDICTED: nuclear transcription factor Y subunit B-6 isoform X2 [Tarenaya hassleriana]|uniref:nuclear transcription factor Y subunit B-6 isoform X2 n=1 Tax=Tarenaya hassleriana TaxID=28532 RepID=UPI00053C9BB4|nr:PREDICTED: nuclear transcription factor Y subunit B-6 isoform X2 [Tarenaya hassleriana]
MERGGYHGFRKHSNTTTTCGSVYMPKFMVQETGEECRVREQDRYMPIANVIRIMRRMLPVQAKISDEAKETIQECVSEYISFVTGEANERCQREQRKTITAEDVLWAMSKLGFDDYIEPLTLYLHRYRELEGERAVSVSGSLLVKRADEYGHFHPNAHSGFFFVPKMDGSSSTTTGPRVDGHQKY